MIIAGTVKEIKEPGPAVNHLVAYIVLDCFFEQVTLQIPSKWANKFKVGEQVKIEAGNE